MDPISAAMVTKALDGLSMRMAATASNIANTNSADHRPQLVRFEDRLRVASREGLAAIRAVRPQVEESAAGRGDGPRMDLELASATDTALRYNALVNLLGRQMEISRAVVRSGQ
jgi:flagellar basal-body rod protein FlgB